jgi:quaternary ammonium compound-resistance protein SugE
MSWFYLVVAGVLEIGWPVGLKWAQSPSTRWQGIAVAVLFMAASGFSAPVSGSRPRRR